MTLTLDELLTQAVTVTVPIKKLKMAAYNPRKKLKPSDPEYQNILKSVTTYGIVEDVVINSDLTIINGHQRVQIYKDLGLESIPCKQLDLDKNMERAANLMFNKAQGVFDYDKVGETLAELMENEIDFSLTGFSDEECKALLADYDSNTDALTEDDEEEEEEIPETTIKTLYLSIGKDKIPLSGFEREWLINLIEEYVDVHDSPVGFVEWLSNNVNHRP